MKHANDNLRQQGSGRPLVCPFLLCFLMLGLCAVAAKGGDPDGGGPTQLGGWPFSDTNWLNWSGYGPVAFTNLLNVPGGDNNCLELNSTNPAFLQFLCPDSAAAK